MGVFKDMYYLKVDIADDGTIKHVGRWEGLEPDKIHYGNHVFMAPVDDSTLLLFGGRYNPGIERALYNDDGRFHPYDDDDGIQHLEAEGMLGSRDNSDYNVSNLNFNPYP